MTPLDTTDARIVLALDADPQATVVALAERLKLARNTVQARLRRLNEGDTLAPTSQRVTPEALGYPLLALVTLSISQREHTDAAERIAAIPEVTELVATTGDGDLLARVVARNTDDLYRVTELILTIPGVVRSSTVVALKQLAPLDMSALLRRLETGNV